MTCASCTHWTRHGCSIEQAGFPHVGDFCPRFDLEPGVDEKHWDEWSEE